jgi:hypothetical protein
MPGILSSALSEGMVVELAVTYVHADTNSADVEVRGKVANLED